MNIGNTQTEPKVLRQCLTDYPSNKYLHMHDRIDDTNLIFKCNKKTNDEGYKEVGSVFYPEINRIYATVFHKQDFLSRNTYCVAKRFCTNYPLCTIYEKLKIIETEREYFNV